MGISLRPLDPADLDFWYDTALEAFPYTAEAVEERDLHRKLVEPRWSLAAHDETDSSLVGALSAYSFDLSVPGGALVPAAGLTMVGVLPTHRRRGVLTGMIRRHLDQVRERGLPLAVLTASETSIYGRFGYENATWRISAEIDTARVGLRLPDGGAAADGVRLRMADTAEALPLTEEIYARRLSRRPGMLARKPRWEERVEVFYPESARAGRPPMGCVLAERDGRAVGYARYVVDDVPGRYGREGQVRLRSLEADDPGAEQALWRYLFSIDLTSRLLLPDRPVDDVWQHLVTDIRRCAVAVRDHLYLRPVEIDQALTARRYAREVDVVLEIEDSFCPWNQGRWRLAGGPDGAVCDPTTAPADLTLSVREIGAAYLGGTSLTTLHRAGRITETRPGAVDAASPAFTTPTAPWLPHGF